MSKRIISLSLVFLLTVATLLGCATNNNGGTNQAGSNEEQPNEEQSSGVVNLYTSRHYETDQELYKVFEEQTGIKVNVVEGKGDELMERLNIEGEATEADVFITADAGNLHAAKESGLLQAIESDVISNNIPDKLRDDENHWFGITKRARVIVYAKDRVDPAELSTYEALTESDWNKRLVVRSSDNMYNISLLASFIDIMGEEAATEWAQGIVNNMARDPQGGDRDQAKAVVAGEADVAIMNTYYIGGMLNSEDAEEVKVAENVGIFFPNQDTTGTHINVSAAGVTKHAKNKDNAIKFIEFLSSEEAQEKFASANFEYPANPNVEPAELLKSWGDFKEQDIDLSVLGQNQQQAIRIFNQVGWK
ncbi:MULTISPECIES: Fe(3+) ABC transporter substrate-binding protein [Sutcliffiella]|uniref:Fe(3+) ABC transporter substrate-binding protein n=1 Tax=Sutcliffiella cohnii TaxID=33932 RepID=A0A223KWR8_9BACI|nr:MULTISPECIES: Fe(3+) ABC transporter substrate-binding protein [Sutcliffiella]AST93857.1 Fe(3+) ABC transporter substrate-binding protein [Sutcliffiella cohnii]WBL15049.1 Fe(3+) ABC transporter substrate-binding protein [Sutcliffiella sp. NC1]